MLQTGCGILCTGHPAHMVPFSLEPTWPCRLGLSSERPPSSGLDPSGDGDPACSCPEASLIAKSHLCRAGPPVISLWSLGTCSTQSGRAAEVGWGGVEMGRRVALRMEMESPAERASEWPEPLPCEPGSFLISLLLVVEPPCLSPVWDYFLHCTFCMCASLVTQSCLTLCNPVECSPPGSSIHGILQARILELAAIPFSRGSCQPRDWTRLSHTGRQSLYHLSHQGSPLYFLRLWISAISKGLSKSFWCSVHDFLFFGDLSS